jgi:hypothetical protein
MSTYQKTLLCVTVVMFEPPIVIPVPTFISLRAVEPRKAPRFELARSRCAIDDRWISGWEHGPSVRRQTLK